MRFVHIVTMMYGHLTMRSVCPYIAMMLERLVRFDIHGYNKRDPQPIPLQSSTTVFLFPPAMPPALPPALPPWPFFPSPWFVS